MTIPEKNNIEDIKLEKSIQAINHLQRKSKNKDNQGIINILEIEKMEKKFQI